MIYSLFINISFPTYSDDSFGNWNKPAINILYDGGVKMFGNETEILGKGRLGYPIYIPIYKALISKIFGSWNDIYINLFQFLSFALLCKFIFLFTFKKSKSLLTSISPIALICSLPLIFFQLIDGYMDLPCGIYSILTIYFLYEYLKDGDFKDLNLGLLFGFILSYIKNDGFVVYFAGILISFTIIIFISKKYKQLFMGLKKPENYSTLIFSFLYFFVPFFVLKSYLNLGWNQAAGEKAGAGVSSFHGEIFRVFPEIFFNEDNYNVILIIIGIIIYFFVKKKLYKENPINFIVLSFALIFLILITVFLITENYKFALDQTTINRVFTVAFFIILSFSGLILKND